MRLLYKVVTGQVEELEDNREYDADHDGNEIVKNGSKIGDDQETESLSNKE